MHKANNVPSVFSLASFLFGVVWFMGKCVASESSERALQTDVAEIKCSSSDSSEIKVHSGDFVELLRWQKTWTQLSAAGFLQHWRGQKVFAVFFFFFFWSFYVPSSLQTDSSWSLMTAINEEIIAAKYRFRVKAACRQISPSVSHVSWSWLKSWKRSEQKKKECVVIKVQSENFLTLQWHYKVQEVRVAILDLIHANTLHGKRPQSKTVKLHDFYLQIPEGVTLFPCISFSLPSTVYLGAHFHAISAKATDVNRDVRNTPCLPCATKWYRHIYQRI